MEAILGWEGPAWGRRRNGSTDDGVCAQDWNRAWQTVNSHWLPSSWEGFGHHRIHITTNAAHHITVKGLHSLIVINCQAITPPAGSQPELPCTERDEVALKRDLVPVVAFAAVSSKSVSLSQPSVDTTKEPQP